MSVRLASPARPAFSLVNRVSVSAILCSRVRANVVSFCAQDA
ncbi:hypothetical protein ACIU1J_11280 [Azospirillum doebereinerae]|nr:hypothetical protein [Azospirillum doebereinerae]